MRYLAKRVERICDELYRLRIVQRIPLTDLICKKGTYIAPKRQMPLRRRGRRLTAAPCTGTARTTIGSARNSPCRKRLTQGNVAECAHADRRGRRQKPAYARAVDMNHRDVLLSPKAISGEKLVFDLQAYTGTIHNNSISLWKF